MTDILETGEIQVGGEVIQDEGLSDELKEFLKSKGCLIRTTHSVLQGLLGSSISIPTEMIERRMEEFNEPINRDGGESATPLSLQDILEVLSEDYERVLHYFFEGFVPPELLKGFTVEMRRTTNPRDIQDILENLQEGEEVAVAMLDHIAHVRRVDGEALLISDNNLSFNKVLDGMKLRLMFLSRGSETNIPFTVFIFRKEEIVEDPDISLQHPFQENDPDILIGKNILQQGKKVEIGKPGIRKMRKEGRDVSVVVFPKIGETNEEAGEEELRNQAAMVVLGRKIARALEAELSDDHFHSKLIELAGGNLLPEELRDDNIPVDPRSFRDTLLLFFDILQEEGLEKTDEIVEANKTAYQETRDGSMRIFLKTQILGLLWVKKVFEEALDKLSKNVQE